MEARDRTTRAPREAGVGGRQRNDRDMLAFLEASGEQPDDALMPAVIVENQTQRVDGADGGHRGVRVAAHRVLDLAALMVQPVELARDVERARKVVGDE